MKYRALTPTEWALASCSVLRDSIDRFVVGRVMPSAKGPSGSVALMVSTFCARLYLHDHVGRQPAGNRGTADVDVDLALLVRRLVLGEHVPRVQRIVFEEALHGAVPRAGAAPLDDLRPLVAAVVPAVEVRVEAVSEVALERSPPPWN